MARARPFNTQRSDYSRVYEHYGPLPFETREWWATTDSQPAFGGVHG